MDALTASSPTYLRILSPNSHFTSQFPTRARRNNHQIRYKTFHKNSSLPFHFPLSNRRSFTVFAQFGRPTSRRNTLRKKLNREHKIQVPPVSDIQHLNETPNLDDTRKFDENVDDDNEKSDDFSINDSDTKGLGGSVLSDKLEIWVEQYKKDSEFWGIGSGPIFTVFISSDGNVERVSVNKDEIFRRSGVEVGDLEGSAEAKMKLSKAENLAKEMEGGGNSVIPRNSSVAKFVVQGEDSSFLEAIRSFRLSPKVISEIPRVGIMFLYGFVAVWALRKLFDFRQKEVKVTESEKEMMRRKIKSRREKEVLQTGSVEVVQEPLKQPMLSSEKPMLDKNELMKDIARQKTVTGNLSVVDSSISKEAKSADFDDKIQEIRRMAREAREIENGKNDLVENDVVGNQIVNNEPYKGAEEGKEKRENVVENQIVNNEPYKGAEEGKEKRENIVGNQIVNNEPYKGAEEGKEKRENVIENQIVNNEPYKGVEKREEATKFRNHPLNGDKRQSISDDGNSTDSLCDEAFGGNGNITSLVESSDTPRTIVEDLNSNDNGHLSDDASSGELNVSRESFVREKPRIIRSVKEAREYLSEIRQNGGLEQELQFEPVPQNDTLENLQSDNQYGDVAQEKVPIKEIMFMPAILDETSVTSPVTNSSASDNENLVAIGNGKPEANKEGHGNIQKQQISLDNESDDDDTVIELSGREENWNKDNLDEQIGKKIGLGFRESYMVARQKKNQRPAGSSSMAELASIGNNELDWMEDDYLAEIVFRVRENELAGRDPFYKMKAEEKDAFFKGLEKKVEVENEKLSVVHEWLHSNIENLDYGIDGISIYDPPEKIIPRWKGPVLEKSPEFLNNFQEQRKAIFAENSSISNHLKDELLQNQTGSSPSKNIAISSTVTDPKKNLRESQKPSKTIIEASDGSIKAGKKSGKEFWQHTKKWSRGFLESYNAETDPEVKSVMKDIGKDLDRWITEKEIQEAGELIDKLPEKNKEFIEKKLSKIKREMELFGPQAVVSKYREYADDKEDYLWWLDLPHILCIELYTVEDGEQRIGFYSLEMATDLELEPKPHHVIAFEDASDCKNLCYIIQAQMELLGNGHAFVVAQPPKDAFRAAKENGFNVTVIRKGELQLNIDQTLEEVEEQIGEIGSKMYHDMIMRERSIDISSLTKGVFGFKGRPTRTKRKRSKKMLKKRGKK